MTPIASGKLIAAAPVATGADALAVVSTAVGLVAIEVTVCDSLIERDE